MTISNRVALRLRRDFRVFRLLRNWSEALSAEWKRSPLSSLEFRNGVSIESPHMGQLDFLFHEIWIDQVYTPPGYDVADGDVVIDIGANLGVFATFAATRAKNVSVYAYEPSPEVFMFLERNIVASRLANIKLVQEAVAGSVGSRSFVEGSNKMLGRLGEADSESDGKAVRCKGLVDVFADHGLRKCDLLKLDCEGAEYEILEGCPPETMALVKKIVGEYHNCKTGNADRLRHILESLDWRIDRIDPVGPTCGTFCATNTAFAG